MQSNPPNPPNPPNAPNPSNPPYTTDTQHQHSRNPLPGTGSGSQHQHQHQHHPLPSLPSSNQPTRQTHAPNLTTYIHHYHYYHIEGDCTVHQASSSPGSQNGGVIIQRNHQHPYPTQNPHPSNHPPAPHPVTPTHRYPSTPHYSYSQPRTRAINYPVELAAKPVSRPLSHLTPILQSSNDGRGGGGSDGSHSAHHPKARQSAPLPKAESLLDDGKRGQTQEIQAAPTPAAASIAASQGNQRRPLGLRLPTLFVPPPAPATTSTSPPSARSNGVITSASVGDSMNDWERVVAMYMTGAGAPDGKPLRDIKRGCGTRVDDRKLLEKRRTIGKTYERLGRVAFERAIGYTNDRGQRRKQRMYQVIARCRVVSKLYKTGEALPDDPDKLAELIEKRLAEKVALNSRDALLRTSSSSLSPAGFPGHS